MPVRVGYYTASGFFRNCHCHIRCDESDRYIIELDLPFWKH